MSELCLRDNILCVVAKQFQLHAPIMLIVIDSPCVFCISHIVQSVNDISLPTLWTAKLQFRVIYLCDHRHKYVIYAITDNIYYICTVHNPESIERMSSIYFHTTTLRAVSALLGAFRRTALRAARPRRCRAMAAPQPHFRSRSGEERVQRRLEAVGHLTKQLTHAYAASRCVHIHFGRPR